MIDDDVAVDAIKIALVGVDVLESMFGFTTEQSAAWMDEFLGRLDSQDDESVESEDN